MRSSTSLDAVENQRRARAVGTAIRPALVAQQCQLGQARRSVMANGADCAPQRVLRICVELAHQQLDAEAHRVIETSVTATSDSGMQP